MAKILRLPNNTASEGPYCFEREWYGDFEESKMKWHKEDTWFGICAISPHFYLVTRQLMDIPKVQNAFNNGVLKLTAECVYSLLIVSVYDKGEFWEDEPSFEAQGT